MALLAAIAAAGLLLVAGCTGNAGTADDAPSAPSKADPAAYTQFVVDQAVARYEAEGLDSMLAHYNDPANVDDEWYVFVIDRDGTVIGHYEPGRRGLDVKGAVGTDINGYNFGPEMLAATESGRWVPYVYVNPAAETLGDDDVFELKNAWVVRHDGLLFGSGWYIDTEELAPLLFSEAAEHFRDGGLEAYFAYSNDPRGITAGLIPTAQYYNRTNTLDGYFTGIVATPDGQILAHIDPSLIGTDIEDLLGPAVRDATAEGGWIVAKDNPAESGHPRTMRMWLIDVDGTLIGGGWYRNESTG
ncbi:cache domain-containing protein [Candidatus Poriferisodalis sp.]|uniref:cache domain-containing protein n=1 Tax=Candidatus Poriferisodalis sp. TaxID=3101277 RepID=UPI003B010BDE